MVLWSVKEQLATNTSDFSPQEFLTLPVVHISLVWIALTEAKHCSLGNLNIQTPSPYHSTDRMGDINK